MNTLTTTIERQVTNKKLFSQQFFDTLFLLFNQTMSNK